MMISEELKKVGKAMQRFGVPDFFGFSDSNRFLLS
jgi:hypothetical protein